MRWRTAGRIGVGWLLTLPAAGIVGALAALVARLGPIGIIIDTIVGVVVISGIFLWSRRSEVSPSNVVSEVADSGTRREDQAEPEAQEEGGAVIDWLAFLLVLGSALLATVVVVITYSLGIRLLTVSGRTPIVTPAEFTDAITVVTPAEAKAAAKRAAKAAKKSPLTDGQKRAALVGARACFALSGVAALVGIYLIVPVLHGLV